MELSWPSSNSRAVVGGGHYEFQNGYQQSDSEDYQHKRDKGVSHSSDEEGNSFSEVLKGLKRKRRRKSMQKESKKQSHQVVF